MRILIYLPISKGGIADYAHDQAEALVGLGHEVTFAAPQEYHEREGTYTRNSMLQETRPNAGEHRGLRHKVWLARTILANYSRLAGLIRQHKPDHVLTHFEEYLAPLWVNKLKRLRAEGTRFHTVLHDPDRNYVVGPNWWHALSVKVAFSLYDSLFVHHRPDPSDRTGATFIPYGIHDYPAAVAGRDVIREHYGISDGRKLIVAFGYIRDNKNLDLNIRALATNLEVELVVAGAEQGGEQKPVEFYQSLARACGVADRVHFDTRFLSQQETADLVAAADFGLLTYARSFTSASAAFSVYANYECSALVSSGSPEMERITQEYRLGIWVEPDNGVALQAGLKTMLEAPPQPDWARYKADHTWTRNAELVAEAMIRSQQD